MCDKVQVCWVFYNTINSLSLNEQTLNTFDHQHPRREAKQNCCFFRTPGVKHADQPARWDISYRNPDHQSYQR